MLKNGCLLLLCFTVLVVTAGCPYVSDESLLVEANDCDGLFDDNRIEGDGEWDEEEAAEIAAYELAYLEEDTLELINQEREQAGLAPLRFHYCATVVARDHSFDMAEKNYFSHTCPDNKTPRDRLDAADILWKSYAENIAYTYGFTDPATAAADGWMNSSGHRKNILNGRYTHTGLGIARDSKGALYFTQVFLRF